MSNTKSSRVSTTKSIAAIVTAEQFSKALTDVKAHGNEAKASIKTALTFIMQATNYKDQQAAMKQLAAAYTAIKKSIGDNSITLDAAIKWIRRNVKAINEKYTFVKSDSPAAKAKAAKRKANAAKSGDKAETKKAEPKKEPLSSIAQLRNALIEKELKLQQDFRGVIPAGKVKEFDQAFAAFVTTIELILK